MRSDEAPTVKIDAGGMSGETVKESLERFSRISGYPVFEGHVVHAYTKNEVPTTDECPRCRSSTRQSYASFIYATEVAPRTMAAPAGFFCTHCPTVIVDQDMIRGGMLQDFGFRGVVGIDHGDGKSGLFKTWDGEESVYLLDENESFHGITTVRDVRHLSPRAPTSPQQREHPKIGRNAPCPCRSGKKFKKCCGR